MSYEPDLYNYEYSYEYNYYMCHTVRASLKMTRTVPVEGEHGGVDFRSGGGLDGLRAKDGAQLSPRLCSPTGSSKIFCQFIY